MRLGKRRRSEPCQVIALCAIFRKKTGRSCWSRTSTFTGFGSSLMCDTYDTCTGLPKNLSRASEKPNTSNKTKISELRLHRLKMANCHLHRLTAILIARFAIRREFCCMTDDTRVCLLHLLVLGARSCVIYNYSLGLKLNGAI
jgi:hypothetical protein